eukprot:Gb_18861 [translate_table: standard]
MASNRSRRVQAPCKTFDLYFDGACRGNPGRAGIGFLLLDEDDEAVEKFSTFLGYGLTNNVAEYKALITGMKRAIALGGKSLVAYGDSELVCKQGPYNNLRVLFGQINGEYKIKSARLRRYYNRVYLQANKGIDHSTLDESPAAAREILRRCSRPESAKKYILDQRSQGYDRIRLILDTIQTSLPASYDAIAELCSDIEHEMGLCSECQNSEESICMCCTLIMS